MIEEIKTQIVPLITVLKERYKPREIVDSLLELAFAVHLQYEKAPASALNNFKALSEQAARAGLGKKL